MNPEYEIRDFIRVYDHNGDLAKEVHMGGFLDVPVRYSNNQQLVIPVTILYFYPNGDYLGEVIWALA